MTVPFNQAIQIGQKWMEDINCKILYFDPRFGVVLKLDKYILSIRLSEKWAYFEKEREERK